jgi:uncharacterized damage-inducible protein DinB
MRVSELEFFPPYYSEAYKKLAQDIPLLHLLEQRQKNIEFYRTIPESQWTYSYEKGKWSIQKIVQHIIDAELIFCYRALAVARGEKKPLMGWEPDEYAAIIDESSLNKEKLLTSLELQMKYTINLFSQFSPSDLKKIGNANGYDTEVAAIGFSIIAHEMHHRNVIQDKYLNN